MSNPRFHLVVHENILREGLLPPDLLGEHRFELHAFRDVAELAPLFAAFLPQALIFDLRQQEIQVEEGLRLLEATFKERPGHFPILGFHADSVLEKWDRYQHEKFFDLGLTQIFAIPLEQQRVNEALQTYLGLQFRKYDRKWLDQEIILSTTKKKYKAKLKIINRECIAIDGEDLPPVGSNVRVKSLSPYPIAIDHPCYVLKNLKPAGLLLRFIDASPEFVTRIEGLPEKSAPLNKTPQTPTPELSIEKPPTVAPDFLQDPGRFLPIDVHAGETFFENYFLEKMPVPQTWTGILKGRSEKARQNYLKYKTVRPELARAQFFHVLFEAQLHGIRNLNAEEVKHLNPQPTLLDHEQKIKMLSSQLQIEITQFLQAKNQEGFLWANELKTHLQKNWVAMNRALGIKDQLANGSEPAPPSTAMHQSKSKKAAPASSRNKITPLKNQQTTRKKVLAAVFLALAGLAIFLAYQKITAPRRAFALLSETATKDFSPYAQQISQVKAQGKIQWTVLMAPSWSTLSEDAMAAERANMLERLKIRGVSQAQFRVAPPARNFAFDQGAFRLPKGRPASQKN